MLITLIDFGLFILIWMTQLVVYPSFTYFSDDDLYKWHSKYTTAISIIVMPLMLGQVGLHAYDLYANFNALRLTTVVLISLAWVNTFLFAVPLHNNITAGKEINPSAKALVRVNWYRTIIWSLVFLISLAQTSKNQALFY